jgi:type II restriction enzyme
LDLTCLAELGAKYKSNSQIARVVTENWCTLHMYCPACTSDCLDAAANNCPGVDFTCPQCNSVYQLKSRKGPISSRVNDSGYEAMVRAIRSERVPSLLLLQYSPFWSVVNLLLIPSFFLTESAIEKRKPLAETAQRAGWIGCNILLGNIPPDGRISVVRDGIPVKSSDVRQAYGRVSALRSLRGDVRGWALDVLNVVRKLKTNEISLSDCYAFEQHLQNLHPGNKNVRAKIRQQLQVLRDLGYIAFEGQGRYRVSE